MADDTEIYLGGVTNASAGGLEYPNVMLLLDTSGSMNFRMYTKYPVGHPQAGVNVTTKTCDFSSSFSDCPVNPDDSRGAQLKTAVTRLLDSLDGDINLGIARYNSDGSGGRIIYPAKRLDAKINSSTTQNATYTVLASVDDATQLGSLGSSLVTSGTTLTLGSSNDTTNNLSSVTTADASATAGSINNAWQCAASTGSDTQNLGNSTTERKAVLFLGAGNLVNSNQSVSSPTGCPTRVGLLFPGITLPVGASITNAQLNLTHYNSNNVNGSTTGADKSRYQDNGAFTFNIQLQNTVSPAAFAATAAASVNGTSRPLLATPVVSASVPSTALTGGNDANFDVTTLVNAATAISGWTWGTANKLAMRLSSNNTGNYATGTKLSRLISGYTNPPQLTINYTTITPSPLTNNFAAVRFNTVDIPRNATIVSAELKFKANANASGAALWEIGLDPNVTPTPGAVAFATDAVSHLDGTRWTGASTMTYTPAAWTNNTVYSINVATLLQTQVQKSSYCGGNSLAFRIRDITTSGTKTPRYAYTYDGTPANAPSLVVSYTLPAAGVTTCTQVKRSTIVHSGDDDVEEVGSGQTLNASPMKPRAGTQVGLRFSNISVPKNSVIRSATLQLKAANSPSSLTQMTVNGVLLADILSFSSTNRVSTRPKTTAAVNWTPTAWVSGTTYTSPELKTVLQEIVNQTDWATGNGLAFSIVGSAGATATTQQIAAVDAGASNAAKLTITYDSADADDAMRRVRQDLIDTVNALEFEGGTPLGDTFYEVGKYMLGEAAVYGKATGDKIDAAASQTIVTTSGTTTYTYNSPVTGGQCQSNSIIMLTDGAPSGDGNSYLGTNVNPSGTTCGTSSVNKNFACMNNTASYLKTTGKTSTGAKISTYTIGFGPDVASTTSDAYKGLSAVAKTYGGGDFFSASDADVLAGNFETIFARIADGNGSMAAPGVAVNQLNRSQNLDQLYYGVFKPAPTKRWAGNLKRYRLGVAGAKDAVLDYVDANAINDTTKYFSSSAKSWWSGSVVDGNDAAKGGAAGKQTSAITVYTDTGAAGAMVALNAAGTNLATGNPAGLDADDIRWVQGIDVDDDNANGSVTDARQAMGAPIHPQPVLVSYGSGDEDFAVFISTNDGLLHSINNSDGTENWAWMPSDLGANIKALRANSAMPAGSKPLYGLDGLWTYVKAADGTMLLVGGMRQGGSNYYAVKLPTTKTGAPSLKWVIKPTTSGFDRLGYTWSQPVYAKVRTGAANNKTAREVLIFSGGLDERYETEGPTTTVPSGTNKGNAIYMVDLLTGQLLWSASSSSSHSTTVSAMKYSITGRARALDKNGDSFADHIYVADLGGQVFRIDLDNSTASTALVKRVALLAQLGAAEQIASGSTPTRLDSRRFYEAPAAAYVSEGTGSSTKFYAAVVVGSGDRNYPKSNKATQDRVYMIKDYDAGRFDILGSTMDAAGDGTSGVPDLETYSAPFNSGNLADLSSTYTSSAITSALTNKKGWFIDLAGNGRSGEKILSSPYIFSAQTTSGLQYQIGLNSFLPDSSVSGSCAPVSGSTSLYTMLLKTAQGIDATSGGGSVNGSDRRIDNVVSGIGGDDAGMIRADGNGGYDYKRVTGTHAGTDGKIPDGLNHMQRTRWYDKR